MLPEDIMIEILSWVPPKWLLHHARYVCKTWAAIIDSSDFAQLHLRHACSKPPSLYLENLMSPNTSYFMDNVNGQFERTDFVTPPTNGNLLVSTCDGIMLFWDGPQRGHFVVNPILKCSLTIPPLPGTSNSRCGLTEFTITRVPRTAKFKLFFANANFFYVLTIGIDNSWKEIARKKVDPQIDRFLWKPVYSGSNDLYWPTSEGVIVIDIYKEIIVGEYPLPSSYPKFLWMGNCLSSVMHSNHRTSFQIYILDIDSRRWTLYQEIGPFDYVAGCGHELMIMDVIFCFWIDDQIIFQVITTPTPTPTPTDTTATIFFGYNVKTKQLTKIEAIDDADADAGAWVAWLHTNSLISLPSTPT